MKKAILGATIIAVALALGVFAVPAIHTAHASASRATHAATLDTCPNSGPVEITSDTKQGTIPTATGGYTLTVTLQTVLWGIYADQGDGPFCHNMYATVTETFDRCSANSFACNNTATASTYLVYRLANGSYTTSPKGSQTGEVGYDNPYSHFPPLTARTATFHTDCAAAGGDLTLPPTTYSYIHVGTANRCP